MNALSCSDNFKEERLDSGIADLFAGLVEVRREMWRDDDFIRALVAVSACQEKISTGKAENLRAQKNGIEPCTKRL